MAIVDEHDDKIIKLITREAERFQAKVVKIDLKSQILDVECPDENRAECAVALQKILEKHDR